jgi:hypothetical protein
MPRRRSTSPRPRTRKLKARVARTRVRTARGRFDFRTHEVTGSDGATIRYLDTIFTIDELTGELILVRRDANGRPSYAVAVYAPGAWARVEAFDEPQAAPVEPEDADDATDDPPPAPESVQ